ncbi:hypothetical protein Gotri_012679 [Gossypium trilobum]|uniref:Uncharacterized protein n=1 Tax=Gossypium trilobum TaxID=34281 RepID=A0A7J9DRJ0_9ROSI|nr:hypothetical protein [Gossypium trilobum]
MEAFVMNNEMKAFGANHEMKAFVANHEMKWNALVVDYEVLTGWQALTVNFEVRNIPKPKFEWTTKEERVVNVNSKALYVIFCGTNTREFKRDFKCTVAKEDSKNIGKFYANLCDLSNQAFDLGKEYSNLKLVPANIQDESNKPKMSGSKRERSSNKLDEILAASRRDIGRSGLGFVDKGKAVMKSPTVFVKGSIHAESEECSSKAAMIKISRSYLLILESFVIIVAH